MGRRFLKVGGDSDSRVEADNVGSEGQDKAETTRNEEVGETLKA